MALENKLIDRPCLVPGELLLHRLVEVLAPGRGLLAVEQLLTQHLKAMREGLKFQR